MDVDKINMLTKLKQDSKGTINIFVINFLGFLYPFTEVWLFVQYAEAKMTPFIYIKGVDFACTYSTVVVNKHLSQYIGITIT